MVGSLKPFAPFAADCHGEPILVWDHVAELAENSAGH
jgi:hypothetical protein